MTAQEFCNWIEEMKAAGLADSDLSCARLLGRRRQWMLDSKAKGTNLSTALACAALLHGLRAYGEAA